LANCKETSNATKKPKDINPNFDLVDPEYEFTKRLLSVAGQSLPGLASTKNRSNKIKNLKRLLQDLH